MYVKDFSVIIPVWRGALEFLPKLFVSIPDKEGIEIIVVDNSKEPVGREEIVSDREFVFLHSDHNRHAGGSRNDGMNAAQGKWLLFADADDYFTANAFDIFYSMLDTDAEIVYTGMGGIYVDTGEPSNRGDGYLRMVHRYCLGEADEYSLRFGFASPCCKMISHALVDREKLRYDEIRAGNDIYFSLTSGFYASKITAVDEVTYIATVNKGSLTRRRDYEVIKARLFSKLHCNQFLRQHGFADRQYSVMFSIAESRRYGIKAFFKFWKMIIQFRQNPFVGWRNWFSTMKRNKKRDAMEVKYIIK